MISAALDVGIFEVCFASARSFSVFYVIPTCTFFTKRTERKREDKGYGGVTSLGFFCSIFLFFFFFFLRFSLP